MFRSNRELLRQEAGGAKAQLQLQRKSLSAVYPEDIDVTRDMNILMLPRFRQDLHRPDAGDPEKLHFPVFMAEAPHLFVVGGEGKRLHLTVADIVPVR